MAQISSVSAEVPSTKLVEQLGEVSVNEPFPTFGGFDLDGNYVSMRTLAGTHQVFVITYFATWCKPCRVGMPIIDRLVQENPKFTGVYIGLGERSAVPVREMMTEMQIDGVVLLDKYKQIGERHGVVIDGEVVLPRTFLVSSTGTLEAIISVEGVDFEEVLRNELKRIEAQIQVSVGHE